jgi:AbrB family looped-hinge helix DNA binding protein
MTTARVSSKYQIVIPKEVREQLSIRPGQDMVMLVKGKTIVMVPDRPLLSMRGFAKGIPTTGFREKKDRF